MKIQMYKITKFTKFEVSQNVVYVRLVNYDK